MALFSQTTDYALRAIAYLATCSQRTCTIPEMAEAIQVNAPYLRKVLDKLREAGIVGTKRGSGGGIHMLSDPDDLTLLQVVNAVDPIVRIKRCPLGFPDHLELCPLHYELDEGISHIEKLLSSRTIGQLLARRRSSARCSFPKELVQLCELK